MYTAIGWAALCYCSQSHQEIRSCLYPKFCADCCCHLPWTSASKPSQANIRRWLLFLGVANFCAYIVVTVSSFTYCSCFFHSSSHTNLSAIGADLCIISNRSLSLLQPFLAPSCVQVSEYVCT